MLSGIVGETTANIMMFILLFAAILLAIFIIYAIIKRLSGSPARPHQYTNSRHDPSSRLAVVDAAIVDHQRKLVLVRRDDVEHLILIGGPTDVVVESNILGDEPKDMTARISEAQIARYQNEEAEDYADDPRSEHRLLPVENEPAKPLPLNDSFEAAPAPSFTQVNPAPQPMAPVQQPSYRSNPAPLRTPDPTPTFAKPSVAAPTPTAAPAASQPRTVMPSAPVAKPAHRAHPAYPLSQVSQGVLTSTSNTAAATAAAAAATVASSATGRLDTAVPQKSATLDEVKPAATAPDAPSLSEAKPEPSFDLDFNNDADNFAALDDALDQALFNDLNHAAFATEAIAPQKSDEDMAFMLEEELLSSLDINTDDGFSVDIEDEMEKLLGELSINPER